MNWRRPTSVNPKLCKWAEWAGRGAHVNLWCSLILHWVRSDQIYPSIFMSDVAIETKFETTNAEAETGTGGGPIKHQWGPWRPSAWLIDQSLWILGAFQSWASAEVWASESLWKGAGQPGGWLSWRSRLFKLLAGQTANQLEAVHWLAQFVMVMKSSFFFFSVTTKTVFQPGCFCCKVQQFDMGGQ